MVTNGGGAVVAALDKMETVGLQTAEITEETRKALREHYPPTYIATNPCDLTCIATTDDYRFAIQKFMEDRNVDIIMLWFVPWFVFKNDPSKESIVQVLASFQDISEKPILVGAMEGSFGEAILKSIEDHRIPVYRTVSTWVNAAGSLLKWFEIKYLKNERSVVGKIETISRFGEEPQHNAVAAKLVMANE